MQRILALGALALSLTLASQQKADAWINFKFGVGLNWHWQSGNNNCLWGVFNNGQVPGPEYFGGGFGGHGGFAPTFFDGHAHAMPSPMGYTYEAPAQAYHPQPSPYHYASYGYYNTMPVYYYPMSWYGR